jgi:hypothetical protein
MPSIRQSATVNTAGWEPVAQTPNTAPDTPVLPTPDPLARSPFMRSSMPLMASTADAFTRQFYGKGSIPQQRILPAKRGAGA